MEKIYVIGHKNPDVDSVISGILMQKLLEKNGYEAEFIIPDRYLDTETYNLLQKYDIDMNDYRKDFVIGATYFLVDHAHRNLNGKIIGIIDHHCNILDKTPEFYINEDTSSAAMIIYKLNKKIFDSKDELLVVLASLVDTAAFNSSKTRKEDVATSIRLIKKNKFDYEQIYKDSLCLTPLDNLRDAAFTGYNKKILYNKIIASSYVQIYDYDYDKLKIMMNIVKDELWKDNIDLYVFLIYDMKKLITTAYFFSKKDINKIKFNKYTSRKEVIFPIIERLYKNE